MWINCYSSWIDKSSKVCHTSRTWQSHIIWHVMTGWLVLSHLESNHLDFLPSESDVVLPRDILLLWFVFVLQSRAWPRLDNLTISLKTISIPFPFQFKTFGYFSPPVGRRDFQVCIRFWRRSSRSRRTESLEMCPTLKQLWGQIPHNNPYKEHYHLHFCSFFKLHNRSLIIININRFKFFPNSSNHLVTFEKKRFPSGSTVKRDELIVFKAPLVLWVAAEIIISLFSCWS